jgi:hypothetical protein
MRKVSQILKDKRLSLNLTHQEVEQSTKIPVDLLVQVESDNWEKVNSIAYLQGIIKKYAAFLGMDQSKVLSYLRRDYQLKPAHFIRETDYEETKRQLPSNWYLYGAVFLIIVFFGIQFFLAWQKPLLNLKAIPKVLKMTKPLIIEGKTQPGVLLYLNDEQIYQNEQGHFREQLFFKKPGTREITIKAIGVNGKEEEKQFSLIVK